ncbi:transposase [uncultured Megasphaera sp.]|uniref:transposase n=1 Tax=uncultured Megasphaera sp. TaxID=165188 RepID=UPI00345771BA
MGRGDRCILKALEAFLERFCGKYPRLKKVFQLHDSLFTFYEFPQSIRPTIYTSNLIENNNKGLKHHAKLKEQFPNEESLERFVCTFYSEYNRKQGEKAHRGFREATAELLDMFPKP